MQKKITPLIAAASIALMLFTSCKKDALPNEVPNENIAKIDSWLDQQMNKAKPNQSKNVETLKQHLDFSRMHIEKSGDNGWLLIVPVDETFKEYAKFKSDAVVNLIAFTDNSGKIQKARLAIYTAPGVQKVNSIPTNTYANIFKTGKNITDGKYTFLSISGRRQFELEFLNGRFYSETILSANPPKQNGVIVVNGIKTNSTTCYNHWWITTTYYPDGTIDVSTEWLGGECYDCDDPSYMSFCGSADSGGGGEEDEYTRYAYLSYWAAPPVPGNDSLDVLGSVEVMGTGLTNGIFLNATWTGSAIPTYKTSPGYSYTQTTGSASYTNSPSPLVTTSFTGTVTAPDNTPFSTGANRTYTFAQAFTP